MEAAIDASPDAGHRIDLAIEGMTCAACAARIEKSLNRLPGVAATVSFATETAAARFDPADTNVDALIAAVDRAGYRAFVRQNSAQARDQDKARKAGEYAALRRDLVSCRRAHAAPDGANAAHARGGRLAWARRTRRGAAAMASARLRHSGPALGRPPVLRRRVAFAARRRRQHGCADRAGHEHGVHLQRRGHAARPARTTRVLRIGCGSDYAGAARQTAGGTRQDEHVRGAQQAPVTAAGRGSRRARGSDHRRAARRRRGRRSLYRARRREHSGGRRRAGRQRRGRREHADRRESRCCESHRRPRFLGDGQSGRNAGVRGDCHRRRDRPCRHRSTGRRSAELPRADPAPGRQGVGRVRAGGSRASRC